MMHCKCSVIVAGMQGQDRCHTYALTQITHLGRVSLEPIVNGSAHSCCDSASNYYILHNLWVDIACHISQRLMCPATADEDM